MVSLGVNESRLENVENLKSIKAASVGEFNLARRERGKQRNPSRRRKCQSTLKMMTKLLRFGRDMEFLSLFSSIPPRR